MVLVGIKLVSGGQTGADRAALDCAIEHGIPHSGWCPHRLKAEDGTFDPRYNLRETPSSGYVQRTESNARDSDGTVVISIAPVLTGGSKKTIELATSTTSTTSTTSRSCSGHSRKPKRPEQPDLGSQRPAAAAEERPGQISHHSKPPRAVKCRAGALARLHLPQERALC